MSVVLSGEIRFPAESLDEARAALIDMMQGSEACDGCCACRYSESLEEPGLFRVFQHWRDEAAFMAAHEQPHFARWRQARQRLGLHGRRYVLHEISSFADR